MLGSQLEIVQLLTRSTLGGGVMGAIAIKKSKLDGFSRLFSELGSGWITNSSVLFSLLLSGSLTIVSGIPAIALPIESSLPIAQRPTLKQRPVESGRLLPPIPLPNTVPPTPTPAPAPSNRSFLVYVDSDSSYLLTQVRQVVPGAFIRIYNGRRVIQSGLFTARQYAQEQIITLRSRGLEGQLVPHQEVRQPDLTGQKLLRAGNTVDVRYRGKERLIIQSGETRELTLTLLESVLNQAGQIILPAGSSIKGQVVPAPGGSQFIARSIQVDQMVYPLNARSAILRHARTPQRTSTTAIVTDPAARAARGVGLGQGSSQQQVTVPQAFGKAASAAVGSMTASRMTVIEPNAIITLQLTSDL